ncbi:glycosyltransferase [Butyrivibrio fibrisolvens]|uniref:glycosyltransferase n=1 Tax=Butyrivibrio fibrisolvens TaxID=831 RepID=UPI000413DC07|nr:glycosyltransferase [Butyrivibrio fibrisolvens]
MKVLFLVNLPSPYRALFFAELGKLCDLTVIYERESASDRNERWKVQTENTYRAIYLSGLRIGADNSFCPEIIKYLRNEKYDKYVVGMYSTYTAMLAIEYLKRHKLSFFLSTDGGFIQKDSFFKYIIKKHFIGSATSWLCPSNKAIEYFVHYGAKREKTYKYPFTSLLEKDITESVTISQAEKKELREKYGIKESKVLLSISDGSDDSIYCGGILETAEKYKEDVGIYILAETPKKKLLEYIKEKKLLNVHCIDSKNKRDLAEYFALSDGGIIINPNDSIKEYVGMAMTFGLPIISNQKNLGDMEIVNHGVNGLLVDSGDEDFVTKAIQALFSDMDSFHAMSIESRKMVDCYSISYMDYSNLQFFKDYCKNRIGVKEEVALLAVGQFIPRKGFDILLEAACEMPKNIGIYIVGGKPSQEYIDYVKKNNLEQIHFVDFMSKEELKYYYLAADVFVHPTREDIWGLVINEAIGYRLPIITTERCLAGVELVKDGINGFSVPVDDAKSLAEAIMKVLSDNPVAMGINSYQVAKNYTIEQMALRHYEIFQKG